MMENRYLCRTPDMDIGPVTWDQLHRLMEQGVVSPGDLYCQEGQPWSDIAGLIPRSNRSSTSATETTASGRHATASSASPSISTPSRPHSSPSIDSVPTCPDLPDDSVEDSPVPAGFTPPEVRSREIRLLVAEYMNQRQVQAAPVLSPRRSCGALDPVTRGTAVIANGLLATVIASASTTTSLIALFMRSRVAWIAVAVGLLAVWSPFSITSLTTQDDAYSQLDATYTEWKELHERDVDSEMWGDFEQRTSEQLSSITPLLERRAHIQDPSSMSLLWISRDYLPQLLRDPAHPSEDTIATLDTHFATVRRSMDRPVAHQSSTDSWTAILLTIDAVLILFAGGWWWKRRGMSYRTKATS